MCGLQPNTNISIQQDATITLLYNADIRLVLCGPACVLRAVAKSISRLSGAAATNRSVTGQKSVR